MKSITRACHFKATPNSLNLRSMLNKSIRVKLIFVIKTSDLIAFYDSGELVFETDLKVVSQGSFSEGMDYAGECECECAGF